MKLNLNKVSANCVGGGTLETSSKKPLISLICAAFLCTGLSATGLDLKDQTINTQISYIATKGDDYFEHVDEYEIVRILKPINKLNGNVKIVNGGKISIGLGESIVYESTKNGKPLFNMTSLEVGRDKATNLTIKDGGILELNRGSLFSIGEGFTTNQNEKLNKSIVEVSGTNSKIIGHNTGDLFVNNGELHILNGAAVENLEYVEVGNSDLSDITGKILLDNGSLSSDEINFGSDRTPTLKAKNGSTIKIKEFYNDNTGSPIINLNNSTFELADNVDNDKFDMVTLNIRNNSNFNINNNSLRTSKPINISNSSNLKAGDLRVVADSVTIDSGSKADFSGAVRTEGGTLTVSGEDTTLNVGNFLRAGQAQYDTLDKNNQPYTEYEKSGLIDIKDKAKVSANDVRVRDVMNVNNANLDTKNISIGISEGAIDEEEGRTYKEKSGTLNVTNNSNINANTLSLYKGVANFKNGSVINLRKQIEMFGGAELNIENSVVTIDPNSLDTKPIDGGKDEDNDQYFLYKTGSLNGDIVVGNGGSLEFKISDKYPGYKKENNTNKYWFSSVVVGDNSPANLVVKKGGTLKANSFGLGFAGNGGFLGFNNGPTFSEYKSTMTINGNYQGLKKDNGFSRLLIGNAELNAIDAKITVDQLSLMGDVNQGIASNANIQNTDVNLKEFYVEDNSRIIFDKSKVNVSDEINVDNGGKIVFDNSKLTIAAKSMDANSGGRYEIKNKSFIENNNELSLDARNLESDEAATLIKDGKGTFSLANFNNTNFKGNLGVNDGVLNIDGDYNLKNGKTLTIGAKSLDKTGKLTANSVNLASGSNIVIENSFDEGLKNTLKNLENDKEFTNPIISARNTLTDDGVKVKDSSAEFSYNVKKTGNDLKLVVKGLDKLEELGGKAVKEDTKFNKTENITDKQVSENNAPLTEDGKKVTTKVEKKLVLGKDAEVTSKGDGGDKTAILVAENGNIVNQGKINADSLIVKKDGAFYADTSSQATLEELKLNVANFEAKKDSKVSINKFNDDEESKSTIKGDVTLTEDNTVKGEFKADENSKLTLQGDTNFEKKLVANKANINSQTKTITANKGVDLTKTDVKVANLTVKEAVDIDGGVLSGVKNINIDNLAQDSTIKDVKIENDDKLKVDIKTGDKNLLLKNVIANNIDHFEFSGHKLTIESGDIKVTGENTFKYDGDGTNGSEALMNNYANVETINAIFGETQNTTVTVDDKSKFTVKDTLNLGKVGNPNGEKTVTLNLKGKSTTDVTNNIIINKDITANIKLDDATLNVNTITKESDAKALNLVAKNSTLNFYAENASLFAGITDQDKIEVNNATFKTDKDNNLGTKISGKNLIKAGNGVLTVENGQKDWSGTEVKEGTLKFAGNLMLGANDDLSIKNKAIVDVGGKFDLNENKLSIGVSKENGAITTGKLKVTGDADFSKGSLYVDAKDAENLFATTDTIKDFVEVGGNVKDFKSADTNMALFEIKKLNDQTYYEGLKLKAKSNANDVLKDAPVLASMANTINAITKDRNALNNMPELLAVNNKDASKQLSELQPLLSGEGAKIVSDVARNQRNALDIKSQRLYDKDTNLWGKFLGNWDSKKTLNSGEIGYDGDHYGVVVGFDQNLNDNLNMGLAFAYTNSDIDSKTSIKHNLDVDTYQVMFYGDLTPSQNSKVDFIASVGVAKNEGKREVSLAKETFKSKYDSKIFGLSLGYGYDLNINDTFTLTPYAKADYSYVKNDGYTESGDSNLRLKVDSSDYNSLFMQAGLKGELKASDMVKLFAKAGIGVDTLDNKSDVNAAFVGANKYKFNIKADNKGNVAGLVNLGLAYTPTQNFEINAVYGGEFRDKYNNQIFNLGLNYKF